MTTFIAGLIVGAFATVAVLSVTGVIYLENDEGEGNDG